MKDNPNEVNPDTVFHWQRGKTMFGKALPFLIRNGDSEPEIREGDWWNQHRCALLMLWKDDCRQRLRIVLAPEGDICQLHLKEDQRLRYNQIRRSIKTEIWETPTIADEMINRRRRLSMNPKEWTTDDIVETCLRWMHMLRPLVAEGVIPDPIEYEIVPGKQPVHANPAESVRQ